MVSFRDFAGNHLKRFNLRPVWSEMAQQSSIRGNTPFISQALKELLLRAYPYKAGESSKDIEEKATRAQVELQQWATSHGLAQATRGRDKAAAEVSAALNDQFNRKDIKVPPARFFQKDTWNDLAHKLKIDPATFNDYMQAANQEYEEKYEPKEVYLHSLGHTFDLDDLNDELRSEGLPEFRFGGEKGYIQHLSDNPDWAKHQQFVAKEPDDLRISYGHSLEDPLYTPLDTEAGKKKYGYVWDSGFTSPTSDYLTRATRDSRFAGARSLSGLNDPNANSPDMERLKKLHQAGRLYPVENVPIRKDNLSVAALFNYSNKNPKAQKWDPERYELLKKWFIDGYNDLKEKEGKKSTSEPLEKVLAQVFKPDGVVSQRFTYGKDSKGPIARYIDQGAKLNGVNYETLRNSNMLPHQSKDEEGNVGGASSYFIKHPTYHGQKTTMDPVDINQMTAPVEQGGGGWELDRDLSPTDNEANLVKGDQIINIYRKPKTNQWVTPKKSEPVDINQLAQQGWKFNQINNRKGTLTDPNGNNVSVKKVGGQWHKTFHTPHEGGGAISPYLAGSNLAVSSGREDPTNSYGLIHTHPLSRNKVFSDKKEAAKKIQSIPQDELLDNLNAAVSIAARRIAGNMGINIDRNVRQDYSDLANDAHVFMHDIAGDKRFAYGDLSRENENEKYALIPKLMKLGLDEKGAEAWIDYFKQLQDSNQSPDPSVSDEIKNIFNRNGYHWRSSKLASLIQTNMTDRIVKATPQLSSFEKANKKGDMMGGLDVADTGLTPDQVASSKELGEDPSQVSGSTRADLAQKFQGAHAGKNRVISLARKDRNELNPEPVEAPKEDQPSYNMRIGKMYNSGLNPEEYKTAYENSLNQIIQRGQSGDWSAAILGQESVAKATLPRVLRNPNRKSDFAGVIDAIGDGIYRVFKDNLASKQHSDETVALLSKATFRVLPEINKLSSQAGVEPLYAALGPIMGQLKNNPQLMAKMSAYQNQMQKPAQPSIVSQPSQTSPVQPAQPSTRGFVTPSGKRITNSMDLIRAHSKAVSQNNQAELASIQQGVMNSQDPNLKSAWERLTSGQGRTGTNESNFISFADWKNRKLIEMAGTSAVYDGTKPKTFNWWGAVGSSGKVIDGDVPVKKKKDKK